MGGNLDVGRSDYKSSVGIKNKICGVGPFRKDISSGPVSAIFEARGIYCRSETDLEVGSNTKKLSETQALLMTPTELLCEAEIIVKQQPPPPWKG